MSVLRSSIGKLLVLLILSSFDSYSEALRRRPPRQSQQDTFCDSEGEGFHSHPNDCTKFVRCVQQGFKSSGVPILTRFNFDCAPGTVFDPTILVCNFPDAGGTPRGCRAKTAEEIVSGSERDTNQSPTTRTTTPESVASEPEEVREITSTPTWGESTTGTDDDNDPGEETTAAEIAEISSTTPSSCPCNPAGSVTVENCADEEFCTCKKYVGGLECDTCLEGYFNLEESNEVGCSSCFCYGHSTICESAVGFNKAYVESLFERGIERWKAVDEYGDSNLIIFSPFTQDIGVTSTGVGQIYFLAPDRFLGDQRRSYNRNFSFTLRISVKEPLQSSADIILESGPSKVSMAIFGDRNPLPSTRIQKYSLKLNPEIGWKPQLSEYDFVKLLSNLTAIKIRGTYNTNGTGYLDNVVLETAHLGVDGPAAGWVENCTCPEGYAGQYCQHCAAGFTRADFHNGPYSECSPCNCNGRSRKCDPEYGSCVECEEGTTGNFCEECVDGFYFNTTTNQCKKCPCKANEPICRLTNGTLYCFAYFDISAIAPDSTHKAAGTTPSIIMQNTTTKNEGDVDYMDMMDSFALQRS